MKNQDISNAKLKLEQGSIINETKISKVKVNVLLINRIEKTLDRVKLLDNYIDCVYKKHNHNNSDNNDNTNSSHNKSQLLKKI